MKSIKWKILMSYAIVLLLLVIIAVFSYLTINRISDDVEEITANDLAFLESSNSMTFSVAYRAKIARDYILFDREEFKKQFLDETEKAIETEKVLQKAIQNGKISKEVESALSEADEKTIKWRTLVTEEIIPLYDSGEREKALQLMEEKCLPYSQEAIDAWAEVVKIQNKITSDQTSETIESSNQSKIIIVIASVIAFAAALIIGLLNANGISKAAALIVDRLETISKGDLKGDLIQAQSQDEIGRLIVASNTMSVNLKAFMQRVSDTSGQVAAASQQLDASAEHSSASAMQVTATIQGIAEDANTSSESANESVRSMEEMAKGVYQIAESSEDVSRESQTAAKQATDGNILVDKAVEQMGAIQTSVATTSHLLSNLGNRSKEIGKIAEMITGIAEQTNLLSLNAAIEAARAGEHGRGFAIVADEVRKLAEQSKESADQIDELIGHIQNDASTAISSMAQGEGEVKKGTDAMNEAGHAFKNIITSIHLVSEKIEEVSRSAKKMAGDSKHVNERIHSLANAATDTSSNSQNAAVSSKEQLTAMQEVSASAASLSHIAGELQEELKKFKF
ncbi:methyl-accepting chemotaxis protein [Metabacillus sp. cB07]|uniref:methyl-accepting chemotaxis protein n=1 Tax=Metabacillus sp. cB07 TaxID=2806989 RepID=UPI00193A7ECA|nr:methyl-accepting chemotaxis protein [Metabacillus sp. cB07]